MINPTRSQILLTPASHRERKQSSLAQRQGRRSAQSPPQNNRRPLPLERREARQRGPNIEQGRAQVRLQRPPGPKYAEKYRANGKFLVGGLPLNDQRWFAGAGPRRRSIL